MKLVIRLALAAFALGTAGCAGSYTHIRKVDDNTYILTRTKRYPFTVIGTVYSCTPVGQTADLRCTEIDSP